MANSFFLERADGERREVKGYKKGNKGVAKKYAASRFQSNQLPPKVDLRSKFTDIEEQGDTNSCTANAVAGAYEYILKRHLKDDAYDVSRLFVYYNARELDESTDDIEDEGTTLELAVKSLGEYGVCSEDTWPFDEDKVNEEPSEEAYEEAGKFLIEEYAVVPTDLFSWKHCLAEGYPIVFGLSLFQSFDKHRTPGLVPEPTPKEEARESQGSHAMVCVGYSDKDQVFIVRNSWGNEWGDDGYCYIPYKYMMNEKYNDGDSWYIRRVDELALEEALWGEDSSVTGDYETELGEMSDEDYQEMLEAMGDVPLETRIALVIYNAASWDGEVSDEELDEISTYLESTFESLGSELSAKKVLRTCRKWESDEKKMEQLLDESIELLGQHLSSEMLATIASDAEEIIGTDDLADEEQAFLDWLTEEWQVKKG